MNKKEELKAHIIKCCVEGNMTVKQAANRLGQYKNTGLQCLIFLIITYFIE